MKLREAALTTFGLGHLRPAPGTWGSLPPCAVAALLLWFGATPAVYNGAMVAIALAFTAVCFAFGAWGESRWGKKDPSRVVADETAGQAVALLLLPNAAPGMLPLSGSSAWPLEGEFDLPRFVLIAVVVGASFVLFRIADIVKPWPARGLQSLRAGAGIVIDDLLAGVYAAIALHAAIWIVL